MATSRQKQGSEYGGVQPTLAGGIQPKPSEAITPSEKLRLGYLTGNENSTEPTNIEDRRQMLGLRPASGGRPTWLTHISPDDDPRLRSEAEIQQNNQ